MHHAERRLPRYCNRRWLSIAAVVLTITAVGALESCTRSADAAGARNVAALAAIVGEHRQTRARLSGGFEYARCPVDATADRLIRGLICDPSPPTAWSSASQLRAFAAEIRNNSQFDAHTAGMWDLVWGKPDDAVADLTKAVRRNPSDARALNDLAVALSVSAQDHDEPARLIDAFVAADSAVRLDGSLKEAQFTLAVLLEQLYLRSNAVDAWKRYLKLDSSSPWADEARTRIAGLERVTENGGHVRTELQEAVSASDSLTVQSLVAR